MTPALRLAISLVLSLLWWLPTIPGALASSDDPAWIAGRYLLSLVVARLGVGIVFWVISGYATPAADDEPDDDTQGTDAAESDTEMLFGRRRTDPEEVRQTEEEALDDALDDAADQAAMVR